MHPVLVAFLFGAAPAFFLAAVEGASVKRRRLAQIQTARRAIAEESAILKTLDADSPAAMQLSAILQTRLDLYTGRRVVRPKMRLHLVMTLVWLAMAAWMLAELQAPTSKADQFVKGAFCGFCATMAVLTVLGVLRAMAAYRAQLNRARAAQEQGGAQIDHQATETS